MDLTALKVGIYRRLPSSLQRRVVRLATPNFSIGVIGLITVDGSQVLLVRPSYRQGWVPPGGFIGRGEEPPAATAREVREEVGLDVDFAPWHRVAFDVRRQGVAFISVGVVPAGTMVQPCSPEIVEVGWFAVDALPPMPNDFFEGLPAEDFEALRRAALKPVAGS